MSRRSANPLPTVRAAARALACVLILGTSALAQADEGKGKRGPWEVMREENGITAKRRVVEGSPLHEFEGSGVVEAPLSRVLAVIRDADRRAEWMADCAESRSLAEMPNTNQIAYNRTKTPWPTADRDVVTQGKIEFDVAKREVLLPFSEVDHPDAPPVNGVVRMPFLRGHWRLVPRGENATLVEYRVHANPGGALPGFVVNWVSQQLPYNTIKNLQEQVRKNAYEEVVRRIESRPWYDEVVGRKRPAPVAAEESDTPAVAEGASEAAESDPTPSADNPEDDAAAALPEGGEGQ